MLSAKVTYVNGLQFIGEGSSHHAIVLDGSATITFSYRTTAE